MPKFEYYGPVMGQARPRFTRKGRAYDPREMKEYKAAIAAAYTEQAGKVFDGPVVVSVHAYRPLAKSTPKKVTRQAWTSKPDADNIAKAVLDALKGVAWRDDSQVVKLEVVKHDRTRGVAEGLNVYIREALENEGSESCI